MNRELKALIRAADSLGAEKLTVVTWDHDDVLTIDGKTVDFVPLWRWLLKT